MAGGEATHPANHFRHPELVSGPILASNRSKRRQAKPYRQICLMRVVGVDQVDFPLPMPTLQLFLAQDRQFHFAEQFEMDERVGRVLRSETGKCVVAMLPNPTDEIRGDPDVDRAAGLASHDVDAGLAFLQHDSECAARWVLKQVQDDEKKRSTISYSVTLNSFQGPFRLSPGARGRKLAGQLCVKPESAGREARWVLKQVQDDDLCEVAL